MAHPRKFRFGVQLSEPLPDKTWGDSARYLEALGYSSVMIPDHFGEQYAPIPAMAAALEATTELRASSLVLDNDYKHPVVTHKEFATLDVVSGGRVELGIGAGWMRSDYEQAGMSYDAPGTRVDRFIEGVEIIRALFGEDPVEFSGEHYKISNLTGTPRPTNGQAPSLLIGGGSPRMLKYAAATADIVGINPSIHSGEIDGDAARDSLGDRFSKKLEWVKQGAGERYDELEINVLTFLATVTDDAAGFAAGMAPAFGVEPDQLLDSPAVLAGTLGEIEDRLLERRERWDISYHVIHGHEIDDFAPLVAKLAGA